MESDLVIKFDDFILTDYFDLTDEPIMDLFAPVNNELVRTGSGKRIVRVDREESVITLPLYSTYGNWEIMKDDLSVIGLDTKLHKLWFSHKPDRYYLAKIDGVSKLKRSLEQTNEATGEISFIVPDGLAHAIKEKTFTFPEPTYKTQPTKYKKGDTWLVSEDVPVVIESDFAGKIAGSLVECPHVMKHLYRRSGGSSTLVSPEKFPLEVSQLFYKQAEKLDNVVFLQSDNYTGNITQILVSFDILSTVKRAYPSLFEGLGESEQVEKLEEVVISIVHNSHGKGSSPLGNKVYQSRYDNINSQWIQAATSQSANISNLVTRLADEGSLNTAISDKGLFYGLLYADPSDGTTPSSVSLDYTNVEITLRLPLKGKLMIATKDSDSFDMTDWEEHTPENIFKIKNEGTYHARPSFEFEILQDTDGFGLVTDDQVLQLGTIDTVDEPITEPQTLIWKDDLTPASRNKWKPNIAVPNFSTSEDRPSKVMGTMTWGNTSFYPANYGTVDPKEKGFWHGPSESRHTGAPIENWDLYSRLTFKPRPNNVKGKKRNEQQALQEVNAYDADNNLICGFHFKDNAQAADLVEYRVYLAGNLVYENRLLRASHTEDGGFFGFLWIRKLGNVIKLQLVKEVKGKQTWVKNLTFTNEDAARLNLDRVDYWMSVWGGRPPLNMGVSYSTLLKTNVEDDKDIPLKFYKGDIVLIDGDTGEIYINGAKRPDYFIDGSKFIECQKGNTDVYLVASDGAVTGKAVLRERFL